MSEQSRRSVDPKIHEAREVLIEQVGRLGGTTARLHRGLDGLQAAVTGGRELDLPERRLFDALESEVEALYDMMVRIRWATSSLPAAPGGARPLPDAPPRKDGAMAATEPIVYIVDDDPSVRRALSRLFRSLAYEVAAFPSAVDFLDRIEDAAPACVVLDVRMPRMSGLDLQQELAKRGSDLPIVFITGHGDVETAVTAMKHGAVDFLPKPFEDQDLIGSVESALAYHRGLRDSVLMVREIEARVATLSPREHEVFERVVKGMLNKQIAYELGTAEKTIKVHRARVMQKMAAESLANLVRMAERIGVEGPRPDPGS